MSLSNGLKRAFSKFYKSLKYLDTVQQKDFKMRPQVLAPAPLAQKYKTSPSRISIARHLSGAEVSWWQQEGECLAHSAETMGSIMQAKHKHCLCLCLCFSGVMQYMQHGIYTPEKAGSIHCVMNHKATPFLRKMPALLSGMNNSLVF